MTRALARPTPLSLAARGFAEMIAFLTHKLRSQTLNERETYHVQSDDDRDSGTESDDEGAEIEELQKYMESIIHLDSRRHTTTTTTTSSSNLSHHHHSNGGVEAPPHRRPKRHQVTPRRRSSPSDSALDSDPSSSADAHSSEEELEGIINGGEKRKWEEPLTTLPLEFRTTPPCWARHIPPTELVVLPSPRKRHRTTAASPASAASQAANQRRPCLDFDKMRQVIAKRGGAL